MAQNEENRNAANTITAALKRKKESDTLGKLRWEKEMTQNEENRNAANTISAALRRKKESNTIGKLRTVRQQKIQKGKEIFEDMKQKRYNDYLQEDASANFNALSKKAIAKQQKRLQTELTRGDGAAIALGMKQDEVIDNFSIWPIGH